MHDALIIGCWQFGSGLGSRLGLPKSAEGTTTTIEPFSCSVLVSPHLSSTFRAGVQRCDRSIDLLDACVVKLASQSIGWPRLLLSRCCRGPVSEQPTTRDTCVHSSSFNRQSLF